eukprot:TRINITY_DN20242_c0_g2_i2.p1 TRINITY_DN20242_c0_g2~~TRINITY_DN20242_c0_g2_i2.p1  ORF type:complete len:369 (+),score=22.78 TRINITY_DN20242_c0_g2_i2:164-1108(+)
MTARRAQVVAERSENAARLLRRVVVGYQIRRKLCARRTNRLLQHRRAMLSNLATLEAQKRAEIVAFEKAQARALLNAHLAVKEHVRQAVDERKKSDQMHKTQKQKLQNVEMDELKRRRRIAEEEILAHQAIYSQIKRLIELQRSQVVRQPSRPPGQPPNKGATPSLRGFQHTSPELSRIPSTPSHIIHSSTSMDFRSHHHANTYHGFPLDTMGRFLLQYERNLKDMRNSLEAQRRQLEFDHDVVRDARDAAASEITLSHGSGMGGTGTTAWVPTRPLPLKDLVKDGPSAVARVTNPRKRLDPTASITAAPAATR